MKITAWVKGGDRLIEQTMYAQGNSQREIEVMAAKLLQPQSGHVFPMEPGVGGRAICLLGENVAMWRVEAE
jgi:hypothetical protein